MTHVINALTPIFVDNFAGGGGASTGIEMAIGRSVDIAINHDKDAIAMHRANHPASKHYCEDVWAVDPVEACNGHPVALAWFSPDCKHFSRAKGGKPVDQHVRGLSWVVLRWASLVRPQCIMLENVPEIQTWGPLGADNRPVPKYIGQTFNAFIKMLTTGVDVSHPAVSEMCDALEISPLSAQAQKIIAGLGYTVEWRVLKSCDYGAPTTRSRLYLIARCDGKPIVWPEPTHAPRDSMEVKSGAKLPYHTAAECIDFNAPMQSIFGRKRPLAENTMKRIATGIQKFVVENPHPYIVDNRANFLIQYHSETKHDTVRGQNVEEPIMTLDTANRYGLVSLDLAPSQQQEQQVASFIMTMRNNMDGQDLQSPLSTISCSGAHHALVSAFLIKYYGNGKPCAVDKPLDAITTKDRFALITVHGNPYTIEDIQMRMLQPRELFDAQGFPHNYIIDHDADGKSYPRSKQVARCGNAVTPPVPEALVRANLPEYCVEQKDVRWTA